MNLWVAREKSLIWLDNELSQEGKALQEGFDYLESIGEIFEQISDREGGNLVGQFCRICVVTLAKFDHLLLASYSLMLDALAQEAGALLRPLIETYELLVYFRLDISRVDKILDGKLPTAGAIAKIISGDFQNLREYLNDNASHFSYKPESIRHLFGLNAKVKPIPTHSLKVLRTNLTLLNAFQAFMLIESVNCLFATGFDANSLANEIENWRDNCTTLFKLD